MTCSIAATTYICFSYGGRGRKWQTTKSMFRASVIAIFSRFFAKFRQQLGQPNLNILETGAAGSIGVNLADADGADGLYFAKSGFFSISAISTNANGISVSINRQTSEPDSTTDRLSINNNGNTQQVQRDLIRTINELVDRMFVFGPEPFTGLFHNQKSFTALIKSHQQMLASLQGTATNIAEQLAAARLKLEQEYAERQSKLEEEFQRRQADSEAAYEKHHFLGAGYRFARWPVRDIAAVDAIARVMAADILGLISRPE
jgi:hypothetical protein